MSNINNNNNNNVNINDLRNAETQADILAAAAEAAQQQVLTLRQAIQARQTELRTATAQAYEVRLPNGTTVNITSNNNPRLDQPFVEGTVITPKQTAAGGQR